MVDVVKWKEEGAEKLGGKMGEKLVLYRVCGGE